jgi:oxygen-dependent protoporphyrinogen oxidase
VVDLVSAERKHVIVIGGGITGLTAAYRLQRAARARNLPLDITVLEREAQLGGKVQTVRHAGFTIEGGPDSFLASKPQTVELCTELGIADHLIGTNDAQRRTYVYSRGRLHDLPEGLSGLVPSRLEPLMRSSLISRLGKVRLLMDFLLPARSIDGDETVAAFVTRRLGRETFERLIEPLMGGIYAGDANQLSLNATFPQLRQMELQHGSLLRGVMKQSPVPAQQGRAGVGVRGFLSLRAGMGELVNALMRQLDVNFQCHCTVRSVQRVGNSFDVRIEGSATQADALIITTPAFVTAELLREVDRELADAHRAIPYVSTATISLAYQRAQLPPLHGFGFVVPTIERRNLLACTWASNKFAERAPDDVLLLRCFIGRAGQEQLLEYDDERLIQIARDELEEILHMAAEPMLTKVFRWMRGMPQYHLGHFERVQTIRARLRAQPGLVLAGAAYRGVGLPDCVRSANEAAQQTLDYLFPT